MTIGETIKRLRNSEGMTVQTLSILTGLSERFINYIERDKKKPSLRSLTKIADAVDQNMTINYWPGHKVVSVSFTLRQTLRNKSFEERIVQLQSRLKIDCLKMCHYNEEKAKDLVQETICTALMYHYRFNEKSQLYTWLYRIAKNITHELNRKDKYITFVEEYIETGVQQEEVKEHKRLNAYINRLSPKAKEVYKLRLSGEKYKDIAIKLGITQDGAKSWFWTIKGQLKKMIV